jgi:hypothetical protein
MGITALPMLSSSLEDIAGKAKAAAFAVRERH